MLNFVSVTAKDRVDVMLGVIRIAHLAKQLDGRWSFNWYNNFEILRANELRQIADKLDDLNGNKSIQDHEKGYRRYEKLRKLNPRQFEEIYLKNIHTGQKFDDLVDEIGDQK